MKKCSQCNQMVERPCSCCGSEFHALSHPNCSLPSARSCEAYWENQEKFRLNQLKELKSPFTRRLDHLNIEVNNLKNYRDNKMANDTKTSQDIKDYICEYIISSEKRIARNDEGSPPTILKELNETRLEWIEYYKSEIFYSRSENCPPNTNCPHWRKYALNENNQQPPTPPTNPQPNNNVPLTSPDSHYTNSITHTNHRQNINQQNSLTENKPTNEKTNQDNSPPKSNSSSDLPKKQQNQSSSEKFPPTNSFSLASSKPSLNLGIITGIVAVALFSIIGLSYLIWKKYKLL